MKKLESLQLIGLNEACQTLNISRPTIYRMIKRGDFSLVKIGRKSLLPLSEFQSYVEKLRAGA